MNMMQDNEEKKTPEQGQAESPESEQPVLENGQEEEEAPTEVEEISSAPSESGADLTETERADLEQPAPDVPPAPPASPAESVDEPDADRILGETAEDASPEESLAESEAEVGEEAEVAEEALAEQPLEEARPAENAEVAVPEEPAAAQETVEKKARIGRVRRDGLTVLPEEERAEKRWYVIHAHSGHENKVKQSLENRVRQEHLEHLVSQILIPSEEVAEVKGGKKRITSRKIFPGYVLVEMKLTYDTWHLMRTTAGVTGFIGSGKMPTPLEPEEVESIFEQMRGEQKKPKPKVSFERDEKVKIIEGPFTNFMGYVDEVNPERGKLKVMVEIFERLTSVELEFWQVEKT